MNTITETKYADLDTYIASIGLEFQAVQIPARTDRNATDWDKDAFHFAVTIRNARGAWSGNYSMGSGHKVLIPWSELLGWMNFRSETLGGSGTRKDYNEIKAFGFKPRYVWQKELQAKMYRAPVPTLRDVLYSLVSDADAIDCATFEDWAINYGYDTDSRSAEKAYRACLESGLKLRAMLGEEALTKLRELFQDY